MINQVKFWGHNVNEVTNKRVQKHDANANQSFKLNIQKTTNISEEAIDKISEQLEDGNFEAIEQLERAGISYTTEEKDNGYKVKFEHGDTKYTITYINSLDFHQKNINQVRKPFSNKISDLVSNSINDLQKEVVNMTNHPSLEPTPVPPPPFVDSYETEEEYAKALGDYYLKLDKRDEYAEELRECIEAKLSLQIPVPPSADNMSEIEYKEQYEIYTKLCEQYNREKEILEKREEMLSKKLQLFESLLDAMFLHEDV